MSYSENMKNTLRFAKWQDYRGGTDSIVINYESSPSAELPVRDMLNVNEKGFKTEPNIETGTYGYGKCVDAGTRNSFVKNRKGYIFFLTAYQGTKDEYKDRNFITGYYHIRQKADVRQQHLRNFDDEVCPDLEVCNALRADDYKFYKIEDAFELTTEKLKEWGYKGKLIKQLKLALSEEKTKEVLDFFSQKTDATEAYNDLLGEMNVKLQEIKEKELEEEEDSDKDHVELKIKN